MGIMLTITTSTPPNERAVVSSALWAAAGDALGWITELTDASGLRFRLGTDAPVTEPREWRRRIGGRYGISMPIPAGTYSDDTQLRLAVSRSIRGSGEFDVEAFAKIELPLWPSYALGAGRSSSDAAANLGKSTVSWFTNFYNGATQRSYVEAGGNGAAMRIQPHVWKHSPGNDLTLIREVLRDALVTHGHPQGFCGAVFHALCVEHALKSAAAPDPDAWHAMLVRLRGIPDAVASDQQLKIFWLPAWEEMAKRELASAIDATVEEVANSLPLLRRALEDTPDKAYERALDALGGRDEARRGAGLTTALLAAFLAWLHRHDGIESALKHAVSALGSDTDTIATMTGAVMGGAYPCNFYWPLQDREYIELEAARLARIAAGREGDTFQYPDIMRWEPPAAQVDAIGFFEGGLALRGLGLVDAIGDPRETGDNIWQWFRLDFGQSVLTKRRRQPRRLSIYDLPQKQNLSAQRRRETLFDNIPSDAKHHRSFAPPGENTSSDSENKGHRGQLDLGVSSGKVDNIPADDIDALSDWVIRHDFAPEIVGAAFLRVVDASRSIEASIALAAILAKAIKVRQRRKGA